MIGEESRKKISEGLGSEIFKIISKYVIIFKNIQAVSKGIAKDS